MIIDVIRTASFIEIEREQRLPFPGQVLVKEGQGVQPGDVLAEAEVVSNVVMLDIAKGLGLSPEETTPCLMRDISENLEQGDVIAQYERTLTRLFRAPVGGKIINYQNGQLAFATGMAKINVKADMIGFVKEIIPEYGAVLSSHGSLIQGVWGNGQTSKGRLQMLEVTLADADLNTFAPDQILISRNCMDKVGLDSCREQQLSGLLVGSLAADLISDARQMPFPVIVLQGFGEISSANDIFDVFRLNNGALASINAHPTDIYKGVRPEVVIPQDAGEKERELGFRKKLEVGDQVRIISGKAISQVGKIVNCLEKDQVFDNGLFLPAAVVKLSSLEKVKVPQQSLIVIG
jgi:hypothetical protein